MTEIRQAISSDLDALYHIALKTGHFGADASHLYADHQMMGHIYAAPYLKFEPGLAFVLEHDDQVSGLCVGTTNTVNFAAQLEMNWWPHLRQKYAKPNENERTAWSADERRSHMFHAPECTPPHIVAMYPAHLHMNLLPEIQGQGDGGKLLDRWLQKATQLGVTAAHIGANPNNLRAIRFWKSQGFNIIPSPTSRHIWMGRVLS